MEIVQKQQGRALVVGQRWQRTQGGQRVRPGFRCRAAAIAVRAQATRHIPDRHLPLPGGVVLSNFALGFVRLRTLDPDAREGSVDEIVERIGQFHAGRVLSGEISAKKRPRNRYGDAWVWLVWVGVIADGLAVRSGLFDRTPRFCGRRWRCPGPVPATCWPAGSL